MSGTREWSWSLAGDGAARDWLAAQSPARFEQNPWWAQLKAWEYDAVWINVDGGRAGLVTMALVPLRYGYHYLWSPGGPVFSKEFRSSPALVAEALAYVYGTAAREWIDSEDLFEPEDNIVFWRHEPDVAAGNFAPACPSLKKTIDLNPAATSRVSLAGGYETVLAAMSQKTRYNAKLAARKELSLRRVDDVDGMAAAVNLLMASAARDGYKPHPPEHYQLLWAMGENPDFIADSGMKISIYAAYDADNVMIAAAYVLAYGDTWTYLHGGFDYARRALMAPYFLHGELLRLAAAAGARWYDLYGIADTDDERHPWAGITRFKKGFGGVSDARPGTYDYVYDRVAYPLYKMARVLWRMTGGRS